MVAVTGQGGVAPFAVQLVGAEHEGAVGGRALGAVGGGRVGVLEVTIAGVAFGKLDAAAGVEFDVQAAVADRRERAGLAVDDLEPPVVAGGDDAVAYREGTVVGAQFVAAESSGSAHPFASSGVELGDVASAGRLGGPLKPPDRPNTAARRSRARTGRVLGAGNGLNFEHYSTTVSEVVAVEPGAVA